MDGSTRLAALALLATLGMAAQAAVAQASQRARTPSSLAAAAASAAAAATGATVTISPLPGTATALPKTQISFLGAAASALSAISVVGSHSGRHSGSVRSYVSATGASFVPRSAFQPGEHVTVHATWASSPSTHRTLSDEFMIARPSEAPPAELAATPGTPADVQSFQSRPELQPPTVTIRQPASADVAPGYLLATPSLGPGQHGPMIFDNAGELVWFDPLAEGEDAADLQTQAFHGKNDLTWWQGRALAGGYGVGADVIANANYKTVAVVKAGNGLQADGHEFTLTPEGSAYVTAYSPVRASTSSAGTPPSSATLDCVVQQIDVHTGLVMREWHSLAHDTPPVPCLPSPTGEWPAVQALANGGSIAATGEPPSFIEHDAHGQLSFEAQLPSGERDYRVYREPWAAQPSEPPAISARTSAGVTAVYASWNGATTVTAWQLSTGSSARHLTAASTTPKSGFETTIPSPSAAYVQVRALSASGKVLAASKAIRPAGA
ncbi:MAG TPA: arylsulfotransferase family protein [Solirubrobacteraceae bacterium]|nr:arylsulfotransferase family protein [Solirubrobacteraceae bacterium]